MPDSAVRFVRMHAGTMTDLAISMRLGISTYKVALERQKMGIRVRKGRPNTPKAKVDRIIGLRRSGMKVVVIAKRFDLSRQRIYQVLSRSGAR